MAYATSILADDGVAHRPHLLNRVLDKSGNVVYNYQQSQTTIPIAKADLDLIKLGMQRVMQTGTGAKVGAGVKYTMAGKTGTAQVVALQQNSRKSKFSGSQYKDHSWFIAFAPVENPKIAIAVIVENGGWGASAAGPIVRQIFDSYLLQSESSNQESQVQYKKFTPTKIIQPVVTSDEEVENGDDTSKAVVEKPSVVEPSGGSNNDSNTPQ